MRRPRDGVLPNLTKGTSPDLRLVDLKVNQGCGFDSRPRHETHNLIALFA